MIARKPTENGHVGPGFRRLLDLAGLSTPDLAAKQLERSSTTIEQYLRGSRKPPPAIEQALVDRILRRRPGRGDFTFIDLFAGIGGMRLGFEAGGGRCVFTSEWDVNAQKTYRANFGEEEIHGDIRAIPAQAIPPHDILLAGFPCQPFSIAGVSKKNALGRPHGFACETQGTLFFEVARIVEHHRPAAFVLENVKNLKNHDGGRTFQVIYRTLTEQLGYHVTHRVMDAQGFVPQHRERIFLVGFRESCGFDIKNVRLPDADGGPRLRAVLHPEDGTERAEYPYTVGERGLVAPKYVLTAHLWDYLKEYKRKHEAKGNGFGFGLVGRDDVARTLSARYYKDGSEILIRRGEEGRARPRRLTPRECARLLGFDRPGRRPFGIPVSDMQAYKQFGNAVVVPLVRCLAEALRSHVLGAILPTGVRKRAEECVGRQLLLNGVAAR